MDLARKKFGLLLSTGPDHANLARLDAAVRARVAATAPLIPWIQMDYLLKKTP